VKIYNRVLFADGPDWPDWKISQVLDVGVATIERV
jgi:hypothetical protein